MKTSKYLVLFATYFFLLSGIAYPQLITDYQNTSKEDLVDALSFSGIDIMKIKLGDVDKNYNLKIIIDEYAGKNNLLKSDTVMNHFIEYDKPSESGHWTKDYIDSLRLISKVINNSFNKIYLEFSTVPFSQYAVMTIGKKYQRKHYWVKFAKEVLSIGKKIPVLFYGSEWDDVINDVKVPRFCSKKELSVNLNEETIEFIPHFFIVSYLFDEID